MARKDEIGPFEREVLETLISRPKDAYGVTVLQSIEERTGRKVSLGALYTTLERLERKGLVRSWWGEATAVRGGRRKRMYAIQNAGMQSLQGDAGRASDHADAPHGALPQGA